MKKQTTTTLPRRLPMMLPNLTRTNPSRRRSHPNPKSPLPTSLLEVVIAPRSRSRPKKLLLTTTTTTTTTTTRSTRRTPLMVATVWVSTFIPKT